MSVWENIKSSFKSLWTNGLRSFLTLLGIVIGVYAVVTLLSAAQGVQKQIVGFVEDFGPRTIMVIPGETTDSSGFSPTAALTPSSLRLADIDAIIEKSTLLEKDIDYAIFIAGLLQAGDKRVAGIPVGITPGATELFNINLGEGRAIEQQDFDNKNAVVYIKNTVAEELGIKIGEKVKLGLTELTLVGTYTEEQSLNLTTGGSSMILIPASLAAEINQAPRVDRIIVRALDVEQVDRAKEEVKLIISEEHGATDFTVLKPTDLLETVNSITDVLAYMVVGIASVSLLVGGIGISNIMLVTVAERTREIGIRKAVGATEGAILLQFLIESVVLTVVGALIGIGFAWITAFVVGKYSPLQPLITTQTILIAVAMGVVAGIVFGIFPAARAARKDPVRALKYE